MGVAKFLKSGRLNLNKEKRLLEVEGNVAVIFYDELTSSDWGYVYEKYVGQLFEDEGYKVVYNGLNLGFNDKGIDLIAQRDSQTIFIQCKYHKKKFSKNNIEWILYKASNELYKVSTEVEKIFFLIVVNSLDDNFSKKVPKGFNIDILQSNSLKYPLLQYYLYKNRLQDKVRFQVREIKMTL